MTVSLEQFDRKFDVANTQLLALLEQAQNPSESVLIFV